jgi:hypothetical protein
MKKIIDHRGYKQRGILYMPQDLNRLKTFNTEALDHWIAKALLFRILRKMNHDVVTEFEITGMGVGDIFDLTKSVQYEVETVSNPKSLKDRAKQYIRMGIEVIVIPLAKLPEDIGEREKALREWVWE